MLMQVTHMHMAPEHTSPLDLATQRYEGETEHELNEMMDKACL